MTIRTGSVSFNFMPHMLTKISCKVIPSGILRAARKCHAAVIVGSPAALASQAVHAEVRELTASKRTIVIIELPSGPISTAVWYPLIQGLAPVRETGELAAVLAGKPSENVCNRLENAFTFWRRNRRIQGTPHGWELRCWRSQRLPARSSVSRR